MDLQALKAFKAVMDLGSVTAAAEQLNTVQPNISARLRKLEEELDTALFLRANRKVTPTDDAHRLLDYANQILMLETAAREDVSGRATGSLRLGCTECQAPTLLPAFITGYATAFPEADIRLDTGVTEYLTREVHAGRLDAAVVVDVAGQDGLSHRPLFPDHLALIAPENCFDIDAALTMPLMVLKQEGCGYRNYALDWCRDEGITPPKIMEISTLLGIAGCVKTGLCTAVLPQSVLPALALNQDSRLFPLTGKTAHIDMVLIFRPELARDRRIAELHQILLSCTRLFQPDPGIRTATRATGA